MNKKGIILSITLALVCILVFAIPISAKPLPQGQGNLSTMTTSVQATYNIPIIQSFTLNQSQTLNAIWLDLQVVKKRTPIAFSVYITKAYTDTSPSFYDLPVAVANPAVSNISTSMGLYRIPVLDWNGNPASLQANQLYCLVISLGDIPQTMNVGLSDKTVNDRLVFQSGQTFNYDDSHSLIFWLEK